MSFSIAKPFINCWDSRVIFDYSKLDENILEKEIQKNVTDKVIDYVTESERSLQEKKEIAKEEYYFNRFGDDDDDGDDELRTIDGTIVSDDDDKYYTNGKYYTNEKFLTTKEMDILDNYNGGDDYDDEYDDGYY